jgi:hypothetical protein
LSAVQLAALVLFLTRPEFADRAQHVKALSLAGNGLTDHHLAMLLDGLQGFSQLERVNLSCNLLGSASVNLLIDVMWQNRAKCVRLLPYGNLFMWTRNDGTTCYLDVICASFYCKLLLGVYSAFLPL